MMWVVMGGLNEIVLMTLTMKSKYFSELKKAITQLFSEGIASNKCYSR